MKDFSLTDHLEERGVMDLGGTILTENHCYFLLYSLIGKITGYQRYFPLGDKKARSKRLLDKAKYFTHTIPTDIAFWGAHSFGYSKDVLFIVEGIFDAVKIHNAGYSCFALLCSSTPKHYAHFLNSIPIRKIIVDDNDGGATKTFLRIKGERVTPPEKFGDLGDMPQKDVDMFVKSVI